MPQEDGSTKKVPCNEHAAAMKASGGDRKGGSECGIRVCNQKMMFNRADTAYDGRIKFCTLSGGGGGACIAQTGQALLVGRWMKDQ